MTSTSPTTSPQVECCLEWLLRLGGAGSAAASLKVNLVPRLSVNLSILDEHNTEFIVTLKTWQNVVSGQHRPTFVLENTSAFMEAHPMKPGDILAIVVTEDNKLQMRTDIRMEESPAIGLKRKLSTPPIPPPFAAPAATAAAQRKRRGPVISLKINSSSMGPATPLPSSPELSALTISASAGSVPHSSADLVAATALVFMSSDMSCTFSLKNEDSTSSGISGSSPDHLDEREMSMESQITLTKNPTTNKHKIKYKVPSPVPAEKKNQTSHHHGFLPPAPLPALRKNSNNILPLDPTVSPFREALLSYSMESLNHLPHFPPHSRPHQQQQTEKPHFCFDRGSQQQHEQRQLDQSFNFTNSAAPAATDDYIRGLMQQEAAITRPVVQSGATVWPSMGMMSHAAMIVSNAMHNFCVIQKAQPLQHEQTKTTVRLVRNQQHGVAISNASGDLPLVVGAASGVGGFGTATTNPVESFSSQFGY